MYSFNEKLLNEFENILVVDMNHDLINIPFENEIIKSMSVDELQIFLTEKNFFEFNDKLFSFYKIKEKIPFTAPTNTLYIQMKILNKEILNFKGFLKCPCCGYKDTMAEWNKKTIKNNYDMNVVVFEEIEKDYAYFTCPSCNEESKGKNIELCSI